MTAILTAITVTLGITGTWESPTPGTHVDGLSTFYADGVMARVIANRGMDLAPYHSGVALNRKGDLGRVVYLQWQDGTVTGPHLSVDCSQLRHLPRRLGQNRVVEVDWSTSQEMGMLGPVPVRVLFQAPASTFPLRYQPK